MHQRHRSRTEAVDIRFRFVFFTGAAALAVAAAIALADLAGYERLVNVFARLNPLYLAVCFGGQVVAYLGYVLAVRDMARVEDGPGLSLSLTTRTVVAGFGVFAATHSAGGFAVDYWALRRSGLEREDAISRVLGLGALEYLVLAPAAMISALYLFFSDVGHVQQAMTLPWLAVVPGFALAAWLTMPKRVERLMDPGDGGPIRQWFAHLMAGMWKLRCLATRPRRHGMGVVGVALYWLGDIATLWAALEVFHAELSLPALILAYATGYVLTRRSLPAGGAGVVEVLMTFALVWVGLGLAPALLGVLFYRLFNFWLPIVPALVVLPSLSRLRHEYRSAERALES
jgi:putative heme transporter